MEYFEIDGIEIPKDRITSTQKTKWSYEDKCSLSICIGVGLEVTKWYNTEEEMLIDFNRVREETAVIA